MPGWIRLGSLIGFSQFNVLPFACSRFALDDFLRAALLTSIIPSISNNIAGLPASLVLRALFFVGDCRRELSDTLHIAAIPASVSLTTGGSSVIQPLSTAKVIPVAKSLLRHSPERNSEFNWPVINISPLRT
jgi:hypothetical protein